MLSAVNATALYMWRSNVLRLRSCSSTTVRKPGLKKRWYSSEKGLPVSGDEFLEALDKVYSRRKWRPNYTLGTELPFADAEERELAD